MGEGVARPPARQLLKGGNAFLFTDSRGDIARPKEGQGLYWEDTRHLSRYALSPWPRRFSLVDARIPEPFRARYELTVGQALRPPLRVIRDRILAPRLLETLRVRNGGGSPASFPLRLTLRADFADTFEVRGMVPSRRRIAHAELSGRVILFSRTGGDGTPRWTRLTFDPIPDRLDRSRVLWDLTLPPASETLVTVQVECGTGSLPPGRPLAPLSSVAAATRGRRATRLRAWTRIEAGDPSLKAWTERARKDLLSLLIEIDGFEVPAAGLPWYATAFGRDSLIVGLQTVHVNPRLSMDVLRMLAARQGRRVDAFRAEEPGKIFHELNRGELAGEGSTPYGPYYGTVDATPLFLCLLHEVYRWTGDLAFCRELFPAAERAARLISAHLEGPLGFLSYQGDGPPGLRHQGWKDGEAGILQPDGSQPEPPIAPCEAQGYAFWGLRGLAEIAAVLGQEERAAPWDSAAEALRERFHPAFWMRGRESYAIALDGRGEPIPLVSSNPGHLLMSGILTDRQARMALASLLGLPLHSPWGIRTLSTEAPYFDPLSYHHGSVWPHDNSLIAWGMARAGFHAGAAQLFGELLRAWTGLSQGRLPELFAPLETSTGGPLPISRACDIQAWAAGVPFLMVRALLGMEADATAGTLRLRPGLPRGLSGLHLGPLRVGKTRVEVAVEGEEAESEARVRTLSGPDPELQLVS